MGANIIIEKADGRLVPIQNRHMATYISSGNQNWALNAEDTINITVVSPYPQNYNIGDKINVFGRYYKLNRLPKVRKTGMREFTYDLEFEGVQYDLLRVTYDLTIDTTNNQLQDVQGDSLTGDLRRFMDVLIANANRVFPGKWALGTCPETIGDKTLTFGESDNCLSVLQSLCDESNFSVEFEIETVNGVFTINLKDKVGQTLPYTFRYGRGRGLYELTRENVSSSNIITRLKVFGSTENITAKYRADRLCLPGKSKAQSYIEKSEAVAKYGIFEARKNFDNIKPTFTGKVGAIVDGNVLQFVDETFPFDLNAKEPDGVTTKYLIAGVDAKVHFNTGNLAGYDFTVKKYDHATRTFTLNKLTDDRGDVFPSATSLAFQFKVGDEYKITDIAYSEDIEQAAENELAERANIYYDQNSQPKVQYGLKVQDRWLKSLVGASDNVILNVFAPGDYLHVVDDDIDVDKSVRIKSFTRNILNPYEYSLTISDIATNAKMINRVISDLIDINKVLEINDLKDPARARANWRSSHEVMEMVFDPDGDYYTEKIKPNSIETLALSIGAKSMQFNLTNTLFQPNYNGNKNVLRWNGGVLTHYTIDAKKAVAWTLADGTVTFQDDDAYYIYAKCERTGKTGTIIFTKEQIRVDSDANYYHFGIGVINSVDTDLNARPISLTYGFSTINGRFIKTGRIESINGNTYFDLDKGEMGGTIKFTSGSSGLENLEEWQGKQEQIDKAESDAEEAKKIAGKSILGTDILFIQTDSTITKPQLPTLDENGDIEDYKGWSTEAPQWQGGKYIWQTTYVKKGNGTSAFADPICISGKDGSGVTITGQSMTYQRSNSGTTPPTGSWSTTIPVVTDGDYLWSRTIVTYSDGTQTTAYGVSRNGVDGENGKDGVTITSKSVKYCKTTTANQPSDASFIYDTIGAVGIADGDYLWSRTTINYSDGSSTSSYSVGRVGTDGEDGLAGASSYVHFAYASKITGDLPHPSDVTDFSLTSFAGANYIGVCTNDEQKDPTTHASYEWSEYKGVGIEKIVEQYYLSTSRDETIGGTWSYDRPKWVSGRYIWTRSEIRYTNGVVEYVGEICATGDNGTSVIAQYSADGTNWHTVFRDGDIYMRTSSDGGTTWSASMRIIGEDGADGKDGQWRKFQFAKNESATIAPTSGWQDTPMQAKSGFYVWMRSGVVTPPATTPDKWDTATRLTGDKGSDGESVYYLDLTNEIIGIACDSDGNVVGNYPTSQATVYKGSSAVTSGVTYSIESLDGIGASITLTGRIVMQNMTADTAEIVVNAVVGGVALTSTISLYKVIPGKDGSDGKDGENGAAAVVYSILPSVSNVIRSMDGTLSAETVSCTKYSTTGASAKVATTAKYLYAKRTFSDGVTEDFSLIADESSTNGNVSITDKTEAVIFELRDSATSAYNVLDRERIPVFADAAEFIEQINGDNFLTIPEKRYLREMMSAITSVKGIVSIFSGKITREMTNGDAWQIVTEADAKETPELEQFIGFYRSQNKGVGNSYSTVKLTFNLDCDAVVSIDYASDGENSHDFLALSKMDETATLTLDNISIAESTTKGSAGSIFHKDYNLKKGVHTLQVMYKKDASIDRNTDSGYYRITTEYNGDNTGLDGSFHRLYWLYSDDYVQNTDNMYDYLVDLTMYLTNTCHLWEDVVTDFTPKDENTPVEPFRDNIAKLLRTYYASEDFLKENAPVADLDYLKKTFEKGSTEIAGGVVMSEAVAVKNESEQIEAMLNGSKVFSDDIGKIVFAAGIPTQEEESKSLLERVKEAITRLYRNGRFITKDGEFSGRLSAVNLFLPFVDIQFGDGMYNYTLQSDSPTNVRLLRPPMTEGYIILPSDDLSFNGMFLNIYLTPRLSKTDGDIFIKGEIYCPNKSTLSGGYVNRYYASEITSQYGGIVQLVNISGEWVLLNGTTFLEYTQTS